MSIMRVLPLFFLFLLGLTAEEEAKKSINAKGVGFCLVDEAGLPDEKSTSIVGSAAEVMTIKKSGEDLVIEVSVPDKMAATVSDLITKNPGRQIGLIVNDKAVSSSAMLGKYVKGSIVCLTTYEKEKYEYLVEAGAKEDMPK